MILEVGKTYRLSDGSIGVCIDVGWAYKICVWYYDHFGDSQGTAPDVVGLIDDTPKTWADMTDAEKGALLLAAHEGKVIEYADEDCGWDFSSCYEPLWSPNFAYRVRPEPKRETVTLHYGEWGYASNLGSDNATHRITFDLINGKPDCASVKMERI